MNPYNWRQHQPTVEIVRRNLDEIRDVLLDGGSGVLLAGRGMGKSVFLRQLQVVLTALDGVRTVLFPVPPAGRTAEGWLRALAQRLGSPVENPLDPHDVVESCLKSDGGPDKIVLLFDELDRYAGPPATLGATDQPGRDFFNSLEAMRRDFPEVGILAAGGIGVFVFRDALGSSFPARADKVRLAPFGPEEVAVLARPFEDDGRALRPEILEALQLATGGNPALTTYGLQKLWLLTEPTVPDVAEVFTRFEERQAEFLRDFQLSFDSEQLSEAPGRVWQLVQDSGGEVSQEALAEACSTPNGPLQLNGGDVLDLLESSGLVRVTGSVRANPVTVHPVASLLSLPTSSPASPPGLEARLREDLQLLLSRLHGASADFYRRGRDGSGKQLVPEAVFASYLALGFDLLGWQAERETQRGAGRTDLLLCWNGTRELAVVEIKIWGRNDYLDVQRQVESYWTADVGAGAVVMLTDKPPEDWPTVYQERCLSSCETSADAMTGSPVRARIACRSKAHGREVHVDHFLVALARRAD